MGTIKKIITASAIILASFLSSCRAVNIQPNQIFPTPFLPEKTEQSPVETNSITVYIPDSVPRDWRNAMSKIPRLTLAKTPGEADLIFSPLKIGDDRESINISSVVYVAVVPFFTVTDSVSASDLRSLWDGFSDHLTFTNILVDQLTANVLTDLWGGRGGNVRIAAANDLTDILEANPGMIAIIPFEELSPRYKVLKINGISPLDKPMAIDDYPLTVKFSLFPTENISKQEITYIEMSIKTFLPETNRDEEKMTVLIMTGTTALTRGTAYKIEQFGTDYPIDAVKDWFLSADLRHVSNEIPFVVDCPPGDIYSTSLRFCAKPDFIQVLEKIGVNVVELTGNHENDYGRENFASTISAYEERDWLIYGGGMDAASAKRPALVEKNGNKIAFIGCNFVGPVTVWAKEDAPGAAECDFEYMTAWIKKLKEMGYVVVTTFQHQESLMFRYNEKYSNDFRLMAEAGADIVQGSQSHYAMSIELLGNHFIHYGLGNFLFDQMDYEIEGQRREFINRHIIYNGQYINTQLLTTILEDYSRPTPMTDSERAEFLEIIFKESILR